MQRANPGQTRRATLVGLVGLVCSAWLFPVSGWAAGRQSLRGHVPAILRQLQPRARLGPTNRLDLVLGLPLRNQPALERLLRDLYDPTSPLYQHYLTPGQFAERFGPTREDYAAVMAFAKAHHLEVTGTHPNRTLLDLHGTVADIEKALGLQMHVYQHPTEKRTFYAPDRDPSLDLAVPHLVIAGLDNFSLPRPAGLRLTPSDQSPAPSTAGSGPRGFLVGRDFRAAYAPGVALDGAGQVLGLMEMDGYFANDVLAYEYLAGLPNVPITHVLVNGFSGEPGPSNGELALDLDMAISMAPGLSKVIVYQGSPTGHPYDVLNRMANDTNSLGQVVARQLSSSWSWSVPSTAAQNQVFQQFVAQGQSFFQASTDDGAYCGAACTPWTPADNPNVTVVGGTTLTTSSPNGAWVSERVWSWFPGVPYASGGGFGTNYPLPAWQQGIDMSRNGGSATLRNSPDVACVADSIWIVADNGQQYDTAGTSAAAPLWAGLAALANQQAAANSQPPIGFVNPALYAIGKSSRYATVFHDTALGNNTNACCSTNRFYACPGYDLCTGWGTPIGSNLIASLLAPPVPLTITPTAPLVFTGPFSGPFSPASQALVLTNDTSSPFNWILTKTDAWLRASSSSGTLTNGGPPATVLFTLNASATNLFVGSYTATLWFTNLSDGLGQSRLVVLQVVAPPVITSQPASLSAAEGMAADFTVGLSNTAGCSFQWLFDNGKSGTNVTDGNGLLGARSGKLVISNVTAANAGAYWVVITNAAGSVTSAPAMLGVLPWRPVIITQPADQSVSAGQTVSFTVVAAGSAPLSYAWQRDGLALTDGGNVTGSATSTLLLQGVSPADAASYSVLITNDAGLAISAQAMLTVTGITSPGAILTTLYSFTGGNDGANPNGLLRASNGSYCGTAQYGGSSFAGTVFQFSPGGRLSPLYSFTGGNDGATPLAGLVEGPDGNFYGTTYQGGASDNGTVFRITPAGVLSSLISLNINNGSFPYSGLALGPDSNFYGTTYQGGAGRTDYVFRPGEVFRITPDGTLTVIFSFTNGLDGGFPAAGVVLGKDGTFYGMTSQGGPSSQGVVYQVTAGGSGRSVASFNRTNGSTPRSGLVQDPAGNFYGTAALGGAYGNGTVFRLSPTGPITPLYSFSGADDGSYPAATLLLGSDGNFYGTTAYGGAYGAGTVFRTAPDGTLTTLVAFNGYAGANPQASLVQDPDGSLYGTTQNGGAYGVGVIYHLWFSGPPEITGQPLSQTVYGGEKVTLSVAVSGSAPFAYQWQKNGTNLQDGGNIVGSTQRVLSLIATTTNEAGTYSVLVSSPAGSTNSADAVLTVLSSPPVIVTAPVSVTPNPCTIVSFNVAAIGNQPLKYRWQKNGADLADTCSLSGSGDTTLVISNATEADNGTYTVLVSNPLGSTNASATLLLAPKTAPCTTLTTRHWFTGGLDGRNASALAQGTNGVLYGTTYAGGSGNWGTVFSLAPDGTFTTLASFMETNGANPTAPPIEGADGRFYGTTKFGGIAGAGTAFAMTAAGVLTTLCSFPDDTNASWPSGPLAVAPDGTLYGTSMAGGTSDNGTVFRLTPDGTLTLLYSFTGGNDGYMPSSGLVPGADGNFYGLTPSGGAFNNGTAFRITPAGVFTTICAFTGGTDGSTPAGPLALGSDGNLYGTASKGGLGQRGTAFKLTPAGVLTTLHAFGNLVLQDGIYPLGGVVQSSDGNLYGTTYADYRGGYGTLFRVAPDGSGFATLLYFDGCEDGSHPQTPLMEDEAGLIYGSTSAGGPCQTSQGTLVRLGIGCAPQIIAQPASQAALIGANVQFGVAVSGARPFTYQWQRNGTNILDGGNIVGSTNRTLNLTSVSLADTATYSVALSNALGPVTSSPAHLAVVYPPVFLSAARSNCTLALTWSAIPGQKYRLEYKPSLTNAIWSWLGPSIFPTSNAITAYDNSCTNAQRFYRVVLTPQAQ